MVLWHSPSLAYVAETYSLNDWLSHPPSPRTRLYLLGCDVWFPVSSNSNEVLLQICTVDKVVGAASVGFLFVCFLFIFYCLLLLLLLFYYVMISRWSSSRHEVVVLDRYFPCIFGWVRPKWCGFPGALSRTRSTLNVRFFNFHSVFNPPYS